MGASKGLPRIGVTSEQWDRPRLWHERETPGHEASTSAGSAAPVIPAGLALWPCQTVLRWT